MATLPRLLALVASTFGSTKRIWLTAKLHRRRGHTKVSWTFRPKKPLPSGRYRLRIRGTDSAGNRERSHRFRGQDRFVVS